MTSETGFYWDETCFWHGGGNFAFVAPVGGLVQPLVAGGLPESPETKRRLLNLMRVTGLFDSVQAQSAAPATEEELRRVHPASYLKSFKDLSDGSGGELGLRTPFGPGGYEISATAAGLVRQAVFDVLDDKVKNAYALSRPPGHHCLPDYPMGFCLMANIAIALEAAIAEKKVSKVAVIDWDVHHGNGTETIFIDRPDVLTISIHQENNFPFDSGQVDVQGNGAGAGYNKNIPLPPGAGHDMYLYAFDQIVTPALRQYKPELIVIASGFDASGVDPLSRTLASADTFRQMTRKTMALADELCAGRVAMSHEGGYSELHVPFCGHAVIAEMSGFAIDAGDPLGERMIKNESNARVRAFHRELVDEMAQVLV